MKEVKIPTTLYWKLKRIAEVHNKSIDEYVTEQVRKYRKIPVEPKTYDDLEAYARLKGLTIGAYLDKLVRTNYLDELNISE